MKKIIFLVVSVLVVLGIGFSSCNSKSSVKLKTDTDSVSYIIGAFWAYNHKAQLKAAPETPLNLEVFIDTYNKFFKEDSLGTILGMEPQEANMYMQNYFQNIQNKAVAQHVEEANKFLAENKGKSGVITTESGLQYKVLTEGKGAKPKLDDVVKIHYHGSLLSGEVFESSVQNGQPLEYPVGAFPEGMKEGLQIMPVGSKYIFWIPTELGENSDPGSRLYSKLLIFELELLEIVKQP